MSDPGTGPVDAFDPALRGSGSVDDETVGAYEDDPRTEALEETTNDAVAGETVYPQPGDGTDDGPTGGAPREGTPDLWEHDDDQERPDLGGDLGTKPL